MIHRLQIENVIYDSTNNSAKKVVLEREIDAVFAPVKGTRYQINDRQYIAINAMYDVDRYLFTCIVGNWNYLISSEEPETVEKQRLEAQNNLQKRIKYFAEDGFGVVYTQTDPNVFLEDDEVETDDTQDM